MEYSMKYLKATTIILICFSLNVRVSADGGWTHITEINGYQVGIIRSVVVGPDGRVWFGGSDGLFKYSDGRFEIVKSSVVINSVAVDNNGTVWIAEEENKLLKYYKGTWTTYTPGGGESYASLFDLSIAPDGSIWGNSNREGLYHFDGETWTLYTVEDGLFSNHVSRLTVGANGDVWCRYGEVRFCEYECVYGGVSRFDGETWETFDVDDGLLNNRVNAIAVSQNGLVFISYTAYIYAISLFDGDKWKTLSEEFGGELAFDNDGVLWNMNSWGEVLRSYDSGVWTVHDSIPYFGMIESMAIDNNGTVWFGTNHGITSYEPSTTVVKHIESLPSEFAIICNYPNPFNHNTTIQFSLPQKGVVDLYIYSLLGQRVKNLVYEQLSAGVYSVVWDGRNYNGIPVASGMYISRLMMNEQTAIYRMMLIK